MKKYSKEEIRNQIAGLGESSIRKNYYQELMKKQEILKAQNKRLEEEVARRKQAEESLIEINDNLEQLVRQRTEALEAANETIKSSYEELKRTQDYLVESEKLSSLGALIVGISHEINTPLGVALTASSFSSMLINQLDHNISAEALELKEILSKLSESDQIVLDNIQKTIRIINDFRKITSDQTRYQFVEFDALRYTEMLVGNLKYTFNQGSRLELVYNIRENMIMKFYPGILSQIITNLISNSVNHGFGNIENGIIEIGIEEDTQGYWLKYKDNGIGIPQDHLGKVFDPFFTTARNGETTGLGLYVIYNLVKKLQGKIEIDSELGLGVDCRIYFPKGITLDS